MDHPSVCLGMMRHIKLTSAARAKALFAAILGCVVAARVGFDRPMQRTLILAGITMNLASFELQDQLHAEARVPTAEECEELWLHPQQSADRLFKAGVRDTDWLNVVLQHHENLDRSGYPDKIGVEAVMPEARILRVADVFSAMVEGRPNRVGYAPRQAMQMTLERERGRLDDSVMLTLRRVIGHYPPGTLVKLANRETAIVTRWFGNAEGPRFVVSFLRPSGNPMLQPRVRSTSSTGNAIRGYATMPAPAPSLDWSSVWAQG
jgi:HD-GYP domain-containing protein (c-di-GMP phosphodiesterase class II)